MWRNLICEPNGRSLWLLLACDYLLKIDPLLLSSTQQYYLFITSNNEISPWFVSVTDSEFGQTFTYKCLHISDPLWTHSEASNFDDFSYFYYFRSCKNQLAITFIIASIRLIMSWRSSLPNTTYLEFHQFVYSK